MATKKKKRIKPAGGRPTKYKAEHAERAYGLCLLGYTNDMLAEAFEVNTSTISEWRKNHKEFSTAITNGKENADVKIAGSLYDKAQSGDTTAQIFWLKNRQSKVWRDKHEVESSGNVVVTQNLDNLSSDELRALKELLAKAQPIKPEPTKKTK